MLTLIGIILMKCLYLEAKLFGDHVCQTEIMEPEEILQWELKNRTIRTYKWCMNVPPRCSVYSHKVFNETVISVINVTKSIETCCEGFYEQSSYCISVCKNCKNGLCLKGTCICQSEWDGPNCDSRILGSNKDFIITTIQTPFSSTINYTGFSTTHTPNELLANITSIATQISISGEDSFSTKSVISSTPNHVTSTVSNTTSKENTVSSSTNFYSSPSSTATKDYKITTISQVETEENLNYFKVITSNITSPKNSLEFIEDSDGFINYTNKSKSNRSNVSEEEFTDQYSTDHRFFDTTATQQTLLTSSVSTDNEEKSFSDSQESPRTTNSDQLNVSYSDINATMLNPHTNSKYPKNNKFLDTTATQPNIGTPSILTDSTEIIFSNSQELAKESNDNRLNFTYSNNISETTPLFDAKKLENYVPVTTLENPDSDVDYRELGGQSVEEISMESPKVLQAGIDKNEINLNVPKTTRNYNGFGKDLEHERTEESGSETTLETIVPVLDKPNIIKDEKENSIFKDSFEDSSDDLTEEKYQKRSFNKNYSHNTLLTKNEADSNNLIYSVCAASATTVLILIVAIIFFTLRNARKKLDKNKEKKDVATVAVYTTSIFHSPLPDPPTFENPTYLATTVGNDNWNKEPNEEMIEVQEFNVVFQKTLKNPKIEDCKQYLYDHPPSTGSYRASSEVDTLSQYNLSQKSLSGIILEPVYDEIPSRDIPMEKNDEHEVPNRNSMVDMSRNRLSYVDNNSLYVNTFGRTKF